MLSFLQERLEGLSYRHPRQLNLVEVFNAMPSTLDAYPFQVSRYILSRSSICSDSLRVIPYDVLSTIWSQTVNRKSLRCQVDVFVVVSSHFR